MDRRGKTDHRRSHSARRQGGGRRFRSAGIRGGGGNRRIFLGGDTALRQEREPGGDEQGAVGAFEHGTERLDGAPVHLAVFREFREVVVEARVDHAIRRGRATAQALEIFKRTAMDLPACRGELHRTCLRPGEAEHLMTRSDELPNDCGADEACSPGDENTHILFLLVAGPIALRLTQPVWLRNVHNLQCESRARMRSGIATAFWKWPGRHSPGRA
jgi:hypothetical protein